MLRRDEDWLSLTPEPERLLPRARAELRSGDAPSRALVAAETCAAERLVLRARRAGWDAWLRDSRALADRAAQESRSPAAVALVRDVVANHDALALGLPGARRSRRR